MNFEEVLDQAIDMLCRRGQLTYRTLKRQFDLDDEALADLSVELIKGQRLAMDEEGEVLVWIGEELTPTQSPQPETGPEILCLDLSLNERGPISSVFQD